MEAEGSQEQGFLGLKLHLLKVLLSHEIHSMQEWHSALARKLKRQVK